MGIDACVTQEEQVSVDLTSLPFFIPKRRKRRTDVAQFFQIHPNNPQGRLIRRSTEILNDNGLIVYPTDSGYALGCMLGNKKALDTMRAIRRLDEDHHMSLVCRNLTEIATYAKLDNSAYRLIKAHTPGSYTFILTASREVPRRLQHPKRKTIGLRVPDNSIAQALLEELNAPLLSTSLVLPEDDLPLTDPYDIRDTIGHQVDLVIDGGYCGLETTTVVDFTSGEPYVTRQGKGDSSAFTAA